MDLPPQYLRDRHHYQIVQRRATVATGMSTSTGRKTPPASLSPPDSWQKFWAMGQEMDDRQIAIGATATDSTLKMVVSLPLVIFALPMLFVLVISIFSGKPNPLITFGVVATLITAILAFCYGIIIPAMFRKAHAPLQEEEIKTLLQDCVDTLEKEYLSLVRDAIILDIPESAEKSVRDSIEALGKAIDRLPAVDSRPLNADALQQEAKALRQQAMDESDRVVSESLERRATALESRRESHDRSAILARRSQSLHSEIMAQIEALRGALFAYQSGVMESGELNRLSESARQVAFESTSIADAQQELDNPAILVQRRSG